VARKRSSGTTLDRPATLSSSTEEGTIEDIGEEVNTMSEMVFEVLSDEEWTEAGAGNSAEKGEYGRILSAFADSGQRFAKIPTDKGRFNGRKASSITTALKNARDSKSAPEAVAKIKVTSKNSIVYLENEALA
jgi:hypothetical protein